MAIRYLLLILLTISLLSYINEVDGTRRLTKTKEEVFNKPSIKSIQTKYGDIYDCVDFYKQPAFDHHLLRNHTYTFQVRPYSYPKEVFINGAPTKATKTLDIWSNGRGCPVGTVPIRRTNKDNLIISEELPKTINSFTPMISGHVHAVFRTTNQNRKYNGVGASIALYNPHLGRNNQYSSGRMKIQDGSDTIQVGWTVNPTLYGDNRTRFFTYFDAGQSHCFNTQCPGFVIVNSKIPLDFVFDIISRQGGPIYTCKFMVYRDSTTGDWWLNFGADDTKVGFWPKRIFKGLGGLASYIDWGGEVYSPSNEPAPYMGSGHPPYGNSFYDAYCRKMTFINEAREIVDATDIEPYVNSIKYYGVLDYGTRGSYFGRMMAFGGGLWLT